ncbi:membrane protein [Pediococcus claussenii]|uniref:Membrane protein n=1 Tax=Pediococcus claussenii (strain ATCC BAA-344 / DSM 14800 / JCM 18046 / KCTC 3811 / LMG 21948 / P06) TaxID=701521 RepID=G8PCB5_PEDCP|nr:membrane protein [Pediococcus claussenii]AEV94900.1 putative membrane protein [Pediococcus claussenii ATCC BAA-344]ANZ70096.1 hypothetical protein AYR57_07090 [Pediococcus claussenii]ANZ71911.1 hypothetical protein AYR58_07090 [Pediococcus claussenii]KRN18849.1 hypothetical protein IV79_GL000348 [Pediococcus claussenii]
MGKRILIGFNWITAVLLLSVMLLASLMPASFFDTEDWAKPIAVIIFTIGLLIIINGIHKITTIGHQSIYKYLLYIIGVLIIGAQLWTSFHFVAVARADVSFVRNQAIALATGSHSWPSYFRIYPNNVNSALFEAMILKTTLKLGIPNPWVLLNILRFIWIDTGLVSGLFILKQWRRWRPGALFLMLTWLFSIPIYAYGLFDYNDPLIMPIGLNLVALAYLFIKRQGSVRWLAGLGTWVLLGFSIVMKSNMITFFIAVVMALIGAICIKRINWKLALKWLLGCIIMLLLCFKLTSIGATNRGYSPNINEATPVTSWIAMSLNPQKQGQYAGVDFDAVRRLKTQAQKKEFTKTLIKNRVTDMGPFGLAFHFSKKLGVFLSHGDFDAINLIPQWIKAPNWYLNQQQSYKFWLLLLAQCWYIALLVGCVWQLFKQKKHLISTSLFSLMVLGLTTFHVFIWEVEPRYSLPLLPILMVLGCAGWTNMAKLHLRNAKKRLVLSSLIIFGMFISGMYILQTNSQTIIGSKLIAQQGDGQYFSPQSITIKPNSTYKFIVPLPELETNKLVLNSRSKEPVTITVKSNGFVLNKIKNKANLIKNIHYQNTRVKALDVTIKNNSKHPVKYASGSANYSLKTGKILPRREPIICWYVYNIFHRTAYFSNQAMSFTLTSTSTVVRNLSLFLLIILLFIWWDPAPRRTKSRLTNTIEL